MKWRTVGKCGTAVRESSSVQDNHMMYHSFCQYGVSPPPSFALCLPLSFCLSLGSYGLPWRLWWSPALSITHSSAAAWGLHNSMMHSPTMSFKSRTKSVVNRGFCKIAASSPRSRRVKFPHIPQKVTSFFLIAPFKIWLRNVSKFEDSFLCLGLCKTNKKTPQKNPKQTTKQALPLNQLTSEIC